MNKLFIYIFKFYQMGISPYLGSNCRYHPSCSEYAIQSFQKFSFLKALWYSLLRILRCNKLFPGGYDPVP
ncbi:MAG: membrane protein insertion efficiency factor YidD [Bacteriovoracaceae bacterium]|nr:membrane protein insertion efficiency factor YidD [Bacteriovoracaceae bacterium]